MPDYLFCFGYEDRDQAAVNESHCTDYESSTGVFIDAPDEHEALKWGQEIAERFLHHERQDVTVSWRGNRYGHWIEKDPEHSPWAHCLSSLPRVRVGQLPDFSTMTHEAYAAWLTTNPDEQH